MLESDSMSSIAASPRSCDRLVAEIDVLRSPSETRPATCITWMFSTDKAEETKMARAYPHNPSLKERA